MCGICSPGDGPLLCIEHRREQACEAAARREEAERAASSTPEARLRRAIQLSIQQHESFLDLWKREHEHRRGGWFADTAELLRGSLPLLTADAKERSVPVRVERSWGRSTSTPGWSVAGYTQDAGNDPRGAGSTSFDLLLCIDGLVWAAEAGSAPATVRKWRDPIRLDRSGSRQGQRAFDSRQAMIAFHNTRSLRWTIDELLGKGPWHEHVISDLAG